MMKNKIRRLGATSLIVMSLLGTSVFASSGDYGASGASDETGFTLEAMLQYAIEDEYLAYAEYDLIINELDPGRPFTNIIKAEEAHIKLVEGLYNDYDLEIPTVDPSQYTAIPETIEAALEAGISAEISNISMYEIFLSQDLPDDVREVFEYLQEASKSHLAAFEGNSANGQGIRNQSLQTGNLGRGNQSGNRGKGNQQNTTASNGFGRNGGLQQGLSTGRNAGERQFLNQSGDCILSDI